MRICRLVYFLSLITLAFPHVAQKDTALKLSEKSWQEISENVDYTETYKEQKKEEKKNNNGTVSTPATEQYTTDLKYMIYFVVVVLIILLIIWISKNFKGNTELKEKTVSIEAIDEIEQNIHEFNLDDLLKEALLAKNYRLALRLNFLIVVKLLSQRGEINWAKEKTNWEYHSELKNKLMADQFKEIIQSFEIFWYGERPFDELQYQQAEPTYKALQKRLTPTNE